MSKEQEKKYNIWIIILSITIPLIVALLFSVKLPLHVQFWDFDFTLFPNARPLTFLPPIYACINAFTALLLVFAFMAIRKKNIVLHKRLMKTAIVLSILFLVMYMAYHMTSDSTKYGGEGTLKYIYYIILLTHILLSVIVIPFVLITYVRAITNNIERHKKIAKITFPLWLYVAISGVLVYIMISPYYS